MVLIPFKHFAMNDARSTIVETLQVESNLSMRWSTDLKTPLLRSTIPNLWEDLDGLLCMLVNVFSSKIEHNIFSIPLLDLFTKVRAGLTVHLCAIWILLTTFYWSFLVIYFKFLLMYRFNWTLEDILKVYLDIPINRTLYLAYFFENLHQTWSTSLLHFYLCLFYVQYYIWVNTLQLVASGCKPPL